MREFDFIKSSYSTSGGECVEVALNLTDPIAIRDSKTPAGPILQLSSIAWAAFTTARALDGRRQQK